jgi:hypothetical protein
MKHFVLVIHRAFAFSLDPFRHKHVTYFTGIVFYIAAPTFPAGNTVEGKSNCQDEVLISKSHTRPRDRDGKSVAFTQRFPNRHRVVGQEGRRVS